MKVSDYIVKFFESKGISDYFGFQGTMIMHFVDSIGKSKNSVNHSVYNEQAAAFAACGYAKATGKCAVAYSTSGPGAINLVSGIADAYYDSAPIVFLTGQVNTTEYTNIDELRQQAFQETDIVSIVKPITKYAVFVDSPNKIAEELEKAWVIANEGRKGPVLLDIPMNIQRGEIVETKKLEFENEIVSMKNEEYANQILQELYVSERPLFIFGNGIGKDEKSRENVYKLVHYFKIPAVTTLLGSDLLATADVYNLGVIGSAYGHRYANWIAYNKADLIISFGASLCRRQIGTKGAEFAKNARIIRVDIDPVELKRKVHDDDVKIVGDANEIIDKLIRTRFGRDYTYWVKKCETIRDKLRQFDDDCCDRFPNQVIKKLSPIIGNEDIVTCDVGQHMMWVMQSLQVHKNHILYSGGHGAMGFALPAAIGAYYGCKTKKKVICIAGDGAFQMNIQELQWIVREKIPICMIVLNNNCLGLIRQQQEDFLESKYIGAMKDGGYTSPEFFQIAQAYGIKSCRIGYEDEIPCNIKEYVGKIPLLLEIMLPIDTKAVPKTYFGQSVLNQKPYIPENLYQILENL